jgi:hypothetical protein
MSEMTIEEMTRRRDHWAGKARQTLDELRRAHEQLKSVERQNVRLISQIGALEAQVKGVTAQLRGSQAETRRYVVELGLLRDGEEDASQTDSEVTG